MAEVIIVVDGAVTDLKNANDIAALKRESPTRARTTFGQLYDVDATIAAKARSERAR